MAKPSAKKNPAVIERHYIDPDTGDRWFESRIDFNQPLKYVVAAVDEYLTRATRPYRINEIERAFEQFPPDFPEVQESRGLIQEARDLEAQGKTLKKIGVIQHKKIEATLKMLLESAVRRREHRSLKSGRSAGGKAAGAVRSEGVRSRNEEIRRQASMLLREGTPKHQLASKLAQRHGLSASRIRKILDPN
jgi:hypothetical protein